MAKIWRKIKPPLHSDTTLIIAFEFALVLSAVAKERGVEMTSEISTRAEEILLKEIKEKGTYRVAMNFTPLILAVLEVEDV